MKTRKLFATAALVATIVGSSGTAFAASSNLNVYQPAAAGGSLNPSVVAVMLSAPGATTIAGGSATTYQVMFRCASLVSDCAGSTIEVTLPAPLTPQLTPVGGFVATTSMSGNTVKFVLTNPLTAGSTGAATLIGLMPACRAPGVPNPGPLVATAIMKANGAADGTATGTALPVVTYPLCTPVVVPTTTTTTTTVRATTTTSSTIPQPTTTAVATTTTTIDPTTLLKKTGTPASLGGLNTWNVNFPSVPRAYVVDDVLPVGVNVHDFGINTAIAVSVDCGSGFIPVGNVLSNMSPAPAGCATPGQSMNTLHYDHITKIRFSVPANTSGAGWITSFLEAPIVGGTNTTNCAIFSSGGTYSSCNTQAVYKSLPQFYTQGQVNGSPTNPLKAPNGWANAPAVSNSAGTPLGANDLSYALRVQTPPASGDNYLDPVITLLLDSNLEYVAGSNWSKAWAGVNALIDTPAWDPGQNPACLNPTLEQVAVGTRTLLRWTFKGCILHGRWDATSSLGIYVTAHIKSSTLPSTTIKSDMTASQFDPTGLMAFNSNQCSTTVTDTTDRDGDTAITDKLCGSNTNGWTTAAPPPTTTTTSTTTTLPPTTTTLAPPSGAANGFEAITASATVKGSEDTIASRYPDTGTTNTTGGSIYTFELKNSGTSPLSRLDFVDVLPSSNDVTVAWPSQLRHSEWDAELVGITTVSVVNALGVELPVPANEVTLGVSTSRNPCRWDSADSNQVKLSGGVFPATGQVDGPSGCASGWTAGPAAGALSFGLAYRPVVALQAGSTLKITFATKVNGVPPAVSAVPLVSWNSVAYTATLKNGTGEFELLTGEPIKVGVRFADPAYFAKVSGVVWNDRNGDGILNDAAGIPGVYVRIVDASNNTSKTVMTDANGAYSYDLVSINSAYRIEVTNLGGFALARLDAGSEPALNSHAVYSGNNAVVKGTSGPKNSNNVTNNFGLRKTMPPT